MQINIPPDAEASLRTKAGQAGFADVTEYVLMLIQRDEPLSEAENAARIEAAIDEGVRSGVYGIADDAFWERQRGELKRNTARPSDS